MTRVRTRFAPSPTGSLHVGNARTAVLNWAVARHHGGDFVLRIEDTDADRNVAGAETGVLADLAWLGLHWDEGPDPAGEEDRGPHGPYRQSGRSALYRRQAAALLDRGAAYRCFCTPEELEAHRARAVAEGRSPGYPGTCRALEPAEAAARAEAGEPHVLRLATPDAGEVVVEDAIRGRVTFDAARLGDFVLVRSDGVPTYNFAVVVDDAEMAITHVIRGAGHLSNTPFQLLVYDALGVAPPVFAHTPTVLGSDRTKLSKRTGARSLSSLREQGVHPDAVVNYLSLLGWSSPSGDEVLDRDRLVEEVTLDRVSPGDVVFDETKLLWLSARHIERMPLPELVAAVRPRIAGSAAAELVDDDRTLEMAVATVRSQLSSLSDIVPALLPFLGPADPGPRGDGEGDGDGEGEGEGERQEQEEGEGGERDAGPREVLEAVRRAVGEVETWDETAMKGALRTAGEATGARGRSLYIPVRRALTGQEHGPPLPAVMVVQGRERVTRLLQTATTGPAAV
jgi:nondiscriminating glutamyl-tRNA synthetase